MTSSERDRSLEEIIVKPEVAWRNYVHAQMTQCAVGICGDAISYFGYSLKDEHFELYFSRDDSYSEEFFEQRCSEVREYLSVYFPFSYDWTTHVIEPPRPYHGDGRPEGIIYRKPPSPEEL